MSPKLSGGGGPKLKDAWFSYCSINLTSWKWILPNSYSLPLLSCKDIPPIVIFGRQYCRDAQRGQENKASQRPSMACSGLRQVLMGWLLTSNLLAELHQKVTGLLQITFQSGWKDGCKWKQIVKAEFQLSPVEEVSQINGLSSFTMVNGTKETERTLPSAYSLQKCWDGSQTLENVAVRQQFTVLYIHILHSHKGLCPLAALLCV